MARCLHRSHPDWKPKTARQNHSNSASIIHTDTYTRVLHDCRIVVSSLRLFTCGVFLVYAPVRGVDK